MKALFAALVLLAAGVPAPAVAAPPAQPTRVLLCSSSPQTPPGLSPAATHLTGAPTVRVGAPPVAALAVAALPRAAGFGSPAGFVSPHRDALAACAAGRAPPAS